MNGLRGMKCVEMMRERVGEEELRCINERAHSPYKALVAVFQSDKLHYNKRYEITSIWFRAPFVLLNGISYYKPLQHRIDTRSRALIRSSRYFMNG